MRTGTAAPKWILGDHLGSTSVVTAFDGTTPVYQRYKPFGETRLTNPLGTKYTFTGQLSHTDDFGLLFFNARWVDPQLARFAQADSIVPDAYNPQDYDRYAYTRNSPLRYIDPSGHEVCDEDGNCFDHGYYWKINGQIPIEWWALVYQLEFIGDWAPQNKQAVVLAARVVGAKFAGVIRMETHNFVSPWGAFAAVYGLSGKAKFKFEWNENCYYCRPQACQETGNWVGDCTPTFGYTNSRSHITFASMSGIPLRKINNVIHELGHAFNNRLGRDPEIAIGNHIPDLVVRPKGFYGVPGQYTWVQSPQITASEIFADQFIGWVYGLWGNDFLGPVRAEFMLNMNGWIPRAARLP